MEERNRNMLWQLWLRMHLGHQKQSGSAKNRHQNACGNRMVGYRWFRFNML